ncbi:MAG TPA: class I SAM-dependent methyltransferase [Steroidobacteraceae bacterium]|jgi:2-polyprenyl-3-methyl-5-hydroxy-6-metoxy-1,4-benzoquinol methylase|nr:class I SAM-dependent methyltransferase [Steroidobacteraceae bacterium]
MNYSRTDGTGDPEQSILRTWKQNALPWTRAVRGGAIESRRLVTDQAIIAAILARQPRSVIDVGCGEGWLLRALADSCADNGLRLTGFDAIAALIGEAAGAGRADYHVASYEDLAVGRFAITGDVVVCNFSLLGRDPVEALIRAIPSMLTARGVFIVQTLHPIVACGPSTYEDGWRETTWDGCGDHFTDPAPWYFRTLGSWLKLLDGAGLRLLELREPLHPHTGKPASVIFVADAMR